MTLLMMQVALTHSEQEAMRVPRLEWLNADGGGRNRDPYLNSFLGSFSVAGRAGISGNSTISHHLSSKELIPNPPSWEIREHLHQPEHSFCKRDQCLHID